jgi:ankyrin repeat protein
MLNHFTKFTSLVLILVLISTERVNAATSQPSLHKAAEQNDIALVKSLLEKGANVNAPDQLGWSPLHYAAYRGHKQAAELLLNNGALVNAKASNDVRPLHLAAEQGQTALAELLLGKGADVNARQVQGWTPLGLAAQNGHLETVKLLLDKGADVNSKSKSGLTPLHTAVSKGCREVVELLLSKGAEVNSKSNNGRTPLHTAAYQNQQEAAKLLLSAGADPNVKDIEGKTPSDLATDFGNVTIAKLIAKGPVSSQVQIQQKTIEDLPTDGVYSKDVGSGGSYKDPINGFFVVQAPAGFEIKERLDKTKFVINEGSSHVGETVPSSFIQFIYANKTFVAVTARKTFTTIEHDFDAILDGLPKKFPGIKIHRHRFVTIDGVKGGEVFASLRGQKLLMVKYKKYGLDHSITINCDDADFPKFKDKFVAFLRSYRSLNSEQDVKQEDGEHVAKTTESHLVGKQPKTSADLPTDGVYSKDVGSGGSYKDSIHGFFEAEPPKGFKIVEDRNRTTTTLDDGTSVPCSRITFQSDNAKIAVVTRKTFKGTIEEDSKIAVNNLRSAGAKIATERFVTIDGSKGIEVSAVAGGYRLLLVKYKKHGLDHAITMSCSPADFPKHQKEFTDFLRSYRSLKSERDVKQADGERPVVSLRQDDKKHAIELKKTESPKISQTDIFKPIGFAVAESVPTYLLTLVGNQRYAIQKPTDPNERVFIVVISAQSDLFIPSEIQYQVLKKEKEAKKKSIVSLERIRIYDPKRFQLILSNGQKLQGEMISDWASDSFGSTSSGFSLDKRKEFTKTAPPSDEIETIAVAWTLGINSCNLPVKVSIDDMVPITVPDQKFIAPRGR